MRYYRSRAFLESFQTLPRERQSKVKTSMEKLDSLLLGNERPFGLGLKHLKHGIWEIRAGLSDRILFRRANDILEFLIVGSHDEIKRFLKNH